MTARKTHGYPVLILGAGRGGSALLEMFLEDELVNVIGIADSNQASPGITLAKNHGIPIYTDALEALRVSQAYPDCIVYNLTHDDTLAQEAREILGDKKVTGGLEAKLFWQMVTNMKRMKEELLKSQDQLQAVIHHAMDGIITISESGTIEGFNPAAEEIFGYAQQEVLGRNVSVLMREPEKSAHDGHLHHYIETGEGNIIGRRGREVVAVRKNGEEFPLELSASEMFLHGQRYFIGIVRDITERKLAEEKITHLAHHDHLTGLPNRILFFDRLKQAISLSERNGQKSAVLFLDLDGFKGVNDSYGHDAGDLLLSQVAARLGGIVRASDTVARVGGDEFTFVLNNIGTADNVAITADKIITAMAAPFDLDGQSARIGGSVGISVFPDDSCDFDTLLKQADDAMYRAKQLGKNTWKFYRDIADSGE